MLGALAQNVMRVLRTGGVAIGEPISKAVVNGGGRAGHISLACRFVHRRFQRGKNPGLL